MSSIKVVILLQTTRQSFLPVTNLFTITYTLHYFSYHRGFADFMHVSGILSDHVLQADLGQRADVQDVVVILVDSYGYRRLTSAVSELTHRGKSERAATTFRKLYFTIWCISSKFTK